MTNITIGEYGYIGCDNIDTYSKFKSVRTITSKLFKELYDFWLSDKQTQKIFTFENKHCLKANSYVGIVQTQNLSVEILPKIYQQNEEQKTRDIFISMLNATFGLNYLQSNKANLSITKNKNIFEGFISIFIQSIDILIHKGIKSDYINKEKNQNFLKGKLDIKEQIRKNHIHKERFYVHFDEYLPNRVENKLLKSTIGLLLKKTKDYENKKALRQQYFIFEKINLSYNYKADISKINIYRNMEYYDIPLKFAKVFLTNKSFTSLRGDNDIFALLFPMEKLFEKYLEIVLYNSKDILNIKDIFINGGKNEYFLSGNNARLEPDYLLKMEDDSYIIADAKWKIVEDTPNSNDIYQMFAYLNFYHCKNIAYLFVPQTNNIQNIKTFEYNTDDKTKIYKFKIVPIDLGNTIKSDKLNKDILI
jgi:5-methylcytosine-specific restriction enzyme subunit McrC